MKTVYILKLGETFPSTKKKFGDFDTWIIKLLGKSNIKIKTINILNKQGLPNLQSAAGFILTGSHSMVSDELPWSLKIEKYIKKIASKDIPLLGICYGHQLIAKALGGRSSFNKNGKEIGRVKIKRSISSLTDPLFKGFPKEFYAFETHYQSAIKLPTKAVVLASNSKDRHQAVRFTKQIWGVQFHPEFDINIMKEYILHQEETPNKLDLKVNHCTASNQILSNFMSIVEEQELNLPSTNSFRGLPNESDTEEEELPLTFR
ncbi:MAG: GMP synthase [glutamine-hydrolyzing] (EC [uncultured Sulfurovum sp.]|uniref:GMP synthase [glutamine-hydrolyzing] (EC) n=1 Tax=uncultured Sulfurovum sp. TaxID=269237 RepID=A0A6S6SZV0_9BACT|nr:MAG: GMP synthase [glutamine-hydrolyzing] (EC [uncultured Sulfurovum sp.]